MSKYNVDPDLIESMLNDKEDIKSFRERTFRELGQKKTEKSAPLIPGQGMASVAELKSELAKANKSSLKISLLDTIISKTEGQERADFLQDKIGYLLASKRLEEAERDIKSLLTVKDNPTTRLLYARVLANLKLPMAAMIEFLRSCTSLDSIEVNEVFTHILSLLFKFNRPTLMSSAGSNINYTLGDNTQNTSVRPKHIIELRGRVPLEVSCGSFHTLLLVSSCLHVSSLKPCEEGLLCCNGGCEVLAWGENSTGKVIGIKTEESIKRPTGVAYVVGQQPRRVSASRALSCVLLPSEIKVWGTLPFSDDTQVTLPFQADLIAVGGDFVIYADASNVFLWGEMDHLGILAMSSDPFAGTLLASLPVSEIAAGEGHALLLSNESVFAIGCGDVGQLGLGPSLTMLTSPERVDLPGNAKSIQCASAISVATTSSHIYVWGLVNPDELEHMQAIEWYPALLEGLEYHVEVVGVSDRELIAIDSHGKLLMWEINYSRRLRRPPEEYGCLKNVRKIAMGKSMHHFLEGILIPRQTQILDCPSQAVAEALFYVEIQLFDQFGPVVQHCPEVSVVFTTQPDKINKGQNSCIEFSFEIIEERNLTSLEIMPLMYGDLFLHVLVHGVEVEESPKFVKILPSQSMEEKQKAEEERKEKEKMKKKMAENERKMAELERNKAKKAQEEMNKKKKAETDRRAQEALKAFKERQNVEREQKERERKQRMELKVGGGFDLKKLKK